MPKIRHLKGMDRDEAELAIDAALPELAAASATLTLALGRMSNTSPEKATVRLLRKQVRRVLCRASEVQAKMYKEDAADA